MIKELYLKIYFKLFPYRRLRKSGASLGKNVFFGEGVYIELENAKLLQIAEGVTLSAFCKIILHDSSLHNVKGFDVLYGKVIIGKNAYIGAGSIILPGTIIGENTIVAAGSLVKGVLKKNSVYAGNPARYRGSIKQMETKWKKKKNNFVFFKKMRKWYEKTD